MPELFPMNGVWAVLLTCATFQLGQYFRKKTGSALCNPILISAVMVIAFLVAFDIPNDVYQSSMKLTSWLMTPCTVCLGIPLYTQLKRMKGNLPAETSRNVSTDAARIAAVLRKLQANVNAAFDAAIADVLNGNL